MVGDLGPAMAWHDLQSALVLNRCEMYSLLDEARAPRSQEVVRSLLSRLCRSTQGFSPLSRLSYLRPRSGFAPRDRYRAPSSTSRVNASSRQSDWQAAYMKDERASGLDRRSLTSFGPVMPTLPQRPFSEGAIRDTCSVGFFSKV